jgi:hypothetical protein
MKQENRKSPLTIPEGIIYCTLRYRGTSILAIEFKHGGKVWRADTVAEAIELRKELEENAEVDALYDGYDFDPEAAETWTADVVTDLLEHLGELQLRFVRLLFDNGRMTSEEIVKKLKLDSEVAFAGVLSGLSKQLKQRGLNSQHLYWVIVKWTGKNKTRTFMLIRQFKMAAIELGWPENWPEKKGGSMPPPPNSRK